MEVIASKDCRVSCINYMINKDAFRRNKSYINNTNLIRSSREYKKCMLKVKQQSRKKCKHKLRTLKTTSPKSSWKILNSNKNKSRKIPAAINGMYEHYKCLNKHNNTINDKIPNDNSFIFQSELDMISPMKNKYIYSTIDLFLPVYKKLLKSKWRGKHIFKYDDHVITV